MCQCWWKNKMFLHVQWVLTRSLTTFWHLDFIVDSVRSSLKYWNQTIYDSNRLPERCLKGSCTNYSPVNEPQHHAQIQLQNQWNLTLWLALFYSALSLRHLDSINKTKKQPLLQQIQMREWSSGKLWDTDKWFCFYWLLWSAVLDFRTANATAWQVKTERAEFP